jgi:hypothetical protein
MVGFFIGNQVAIYKTANRSSSWVYQAPKVVVNLKTGSRYLKSRLSGQTAPKGSAEVEDNGTNGKREKRRYCNHFSRLKQLARRPKIELHRSVQ